MHIEQFRAACLNKKGAEETFPFGAETLVFKVAGKVFAITSLDEPDRCNLKCDPGMAIDLRNRYDAIVPGYHMNKRHWNTVVYNQDLSDKEILNLLDHSYDLVVKRLPVKQRDLLKSV